MPNYTCGDTFDDVSEYESDDGTTYPIAGQAGAGAYAIARVAKSKNTPDEVIVLSPRKGKTVDFIEATTKYRFFRALYPDAKIAFFDDRETLDDPTYRTVLPRIPGYPYTQLMPHTEKEKINLFLSAIEALEDAHEKGKVVVDLQENNIFYHQPENKSYLIDGGLSANKGSPLRDDVFCSTDHAHLAQQKALHNHIAPECWSRRPVIANEKMDIYSLGHLMEKTLLCPPARVNALIDACKQPNPQNRPSLRELKHDLAFLLEHISLPPKKRALQQVFFKTLAEAAKEEEEKQTSKKAAKRTNTSSSASGA